MKRRKDGTFTSKGLKGNQFAKGNKPNSNTFRKGKRHTMQNHPSWGDGVQRMSKDCAYITVGTNKRKRRPRAVWESVYGALPKGYVLYHKDGDKNNDEIENLEAITRAELLQRNGRLNS